MGRLLRSPRLLQLDISDSVRSQHSCRAFHHRSRPRGWFSPHAADSCAGFLAARHFFLLWRLSLFYVCCQSIFLRWRLSLCVIMHPRAFLTSMTRFSTFLSSLAAG